MADTTPTAPMPNPAAADAVENVTSEQDINPWSVTGAQDESGEVAAIDYINLARYDPCPSPALAVPALAPSPKFQNIALHVHVHWPLLTRRADRKWNTSMIDEKLLERFERVTGHKPHRWLRRGLFFSHRDFDKILDKHEKGEPFFLYTGRGPSSGSLHLGHTIPLQFTRWLQEVFDVPLVFMLTDDEKALFKDSLSFEDVLHFAHENAKDIIALGFDVKKTFIYSDLKYVGGHMLMNAWEFSKLVTFNQVRGAFGFNESTNIGKIFFPSLQCVAAFATSYPEIWTDEPLKERTKEIAKIPCLIPMGIDQDPYFRLLRDNAGRMKNPSPKPALIHSKFLTALQGPGGKMSSSNPNSAIFMTDTAKQIKVSFDNCPPLPAFSVNRRHAHY